MRVAIRGGRGVRPGARRLPLPAVLAALVLLVPATPALADSLPPVPIDVTETVGASDGAAALPPADASSSDAVAVNDTSTVLGPLLYDDGEVVYVADSLSVLPPLVVAAGEGVIVTDGAAVLGPADASATDTVHAGDAASVLGPVFAETADTAHVSDNAVVLPPAVIAVLDSITANDSPVVLPPVEVDARETVGASDGAVVLPPVTVDATDTIAASDGADVLPPVLVQQDDHVAVSDDSGSQVVNTTPQVTLPDLAGPEGSLLGAPGSFVDPDPQLWAATVDYGDGSSTVPLDLTGKTFALSHAYDDNGSYTITVRVTDSTGSTGTATSTARITNVAPTATVTADTSTAEGSPATVSLSSPADVSAADTRAGFSYAFACDGEHFGDTQAAPTASCTFDDGPATRHVLARVLDKDGGATTYGADIAVTNVAPTAELGNNGPVAEGSPVGIHFRLAHDPSAADTSAGFVYQVACDGTSFAPAAGGNTTCTFDDGPSSHIVVGRITDKDGGTTEVRTTVNVTNAAPTATLSMPAVVDEGSLFNVAVTSPGDPSAADTRAGFGYSFACDGAAFSPAAPVSTTPCVFDDGPSSHVVRARISDKDGGTTLLEATVFVRNVAPQATFVAPPPLDEGSSFTLALTAAHDPSAADTAAHFTYAFDCGDGLGLSAFTAAALRSCPTDDNGGRSVTAQVRDKDGAVTSYTGNVVIRSVAPTATFVTPGDPVAEGSKFTVALTAPADPSARDVVAGFTYAFDCGAGYGPAATTASALCPAVDNPSANMRAKIIDKDGAATEYAAAVGVANVAPSVTLTAPQAGSVGVPIALAASFTDPGIRDTHTCSVAWGDGTTSTGSVTEQGGSGTCAASHSYSSATVTTATLTITDKDGGSGSAATQVVVVDQNAGFITGNGWIVAGGQRVTFALDAKYKKGGALTGNVDVQTPAGSLHGTELQWLVVAGTRAELRGAATLDGRTGFTFQIVGDDSPKAFRVGIWNGPSLVYDSVPGAPWDLRAALPQPLGGGSIQVH
jgi:PKD domain